MHKICLAVALVTGLTMLTGCGGGDQSATAASAAPAAPATSAPAASRAGADSIGVPECDEYVTKYMECVAAKVPEAARVQYKAAFDQAIKGWRQAASTPEGKAGLAAGCKQAQVASAQAMAAYGCTF